MTGSSPAKIRLIGSRQVVELMPMDRCIELMRHAFKLVSEGKTAQPIRQMVRTLDQTGLLGWMPGYVDEPRRLGIKAITIFPGAVAKGIKSHQGVVMLFEADTGQPLAVVDAAEITGIRTAAATAAATDALARSDAKTLSIFGLGEQAHTHLRSLTQVRKFERILIWGRDAAKTRAFITDHAADSPVPMEAAASAEAAAGSDVLCLVTGAPEPFFKGAWLKPGQHINLVGSSVPMTSEVDHETVTRSRVFADYRDSALALGGEIKRAREAGLIGDEHVLGEVGDVLLGKAHGRRSAEDITLFKSLGMAAEDVLSADFIYEEAVRQGVGTVVDW